MSNQGEVASGDGKDHTIAFEERYRAAMENGRLSELSPLRADDRQVMQRHGETGMASAQGLLDEGDAAAQCAFGLAPALCSGLERAETGQRGADFVVFRVQAATEGHQSAAIEFPGLAKTPQLDKDRCQRSLVCRERNGILRAVALPQLHSVARVPQRPRVAPAGVLHAPKVVIEGGDEFRARFGSGPKEFERSLVIARSQAKPPSVLADDAKIIQQDCDLGAAGSGRRFCNPQSAEKIVLCSKVITARRVPQCACVKGGDFLAFDI